MKSFIRWFVDSVARMGTDVICRIEKDDLSKVPEAGPLILAGNHIGSLEVPVLLTHLQPRVIYGLAKVETWDNKFMAWLFDLWNGIPVRRGEADMDAIRACLDVLKSGNILAIAPEGTRSNDGHLLRGQPGTALIALRSNAPILPMAHWGGEYFNGNLKKLKRTDFHFRVGKPFYLDPKGQKVDGKMRQDMADEIMCQIAALMPKEYRGLYADCSTQPKYLHFL